MLCVSRPQESALLPCTSAFIGFRQVVSYMTWLISFRLSPTCILLILFLILYDLVDSFGTIGLLHEYMLSKLYSVCKL